MKFQLKSDKSFNYNGKLIVGNSEVTIKGMKCITNFKKFLEENGIDYISECGGPGLKIHTSGKNKKNIIGTGGIQLGFHL